MVSVGVKVRSPISWRRKKVRDPPPLLTPSMTGTKKRRVRLLLYGIKLAVMEEQHCVRCVMLNESFSLLSRIEDVISFCKGK